MKARPLPFDQVASLPAVEAKAAKHVDIFNTLSVDGCLLDCPTWQLKHRLAHQRTTNKAEKRAKRKELRAFGKSSLQNQRQKLVSDKSVLNSQLRLKREPFRMHDLDASSQKGCQCCRFFKVLLDALFSTRKTLAREEFELEWVGYGFFLKLSHKQSGQFLSYQLFAPSGAGTRLVGLPSANIISGDNSATVSFDKAREWINECEISHRQCGTARNVPLPKRLLDLGIDDQATTIKLADTEHMTGTYACLSHCWGKDEMPVTTTLATLKDHFQAVLLSELPKTFQDAVAISRRIGLRYLWIDSLCIIQDSAEDWEVESSKMADIYRHGFVTIAAVSSPDFRGGCFSPERRKDLCFKVEGDCIETMVSMRDGNGEDRFTDAVQFGKALPLLTRGWVYQERMLSRRILYYNHRELQFECREQTTCECGNHSMPPHFLPGSQAGRGMLQGKDQYAGLEKFDGTRGKFSPHQVTQHWQQTVAQYTKLGLTKPADKLPALSGCAKDIARLTGNRYLAGIWERSFAEDMLWTVEPPINQPRPDLEDPKNPKAMRAPSWSWASVDAAAGIKYTYAENTRHRQAFQDRIRESKCVLGGTDPTGTVKSGFVRLQTSILRVPLRRICRRCTTSRSRTVYTVEYDAWLSTRSPSIKPCTFDVQGLDSLDLGGARPSFFPDFKYDDRTDFDFLDAEDAGACKLTDVFLLHLYDSQSFETPIVIDFFLVLRAATTSGADTYERIAMMTLEFQNWTARDSWFSNTFDQRKAEERLITIV